MTFFIHRRTCIHPSPNNQIRSDNVNILRTQAFVELARSPVEWLFLPVLGLISSTCCLIFGCVADPGVVFGTGILYLTQWRLPEVQVQWRSHDDDGTDYVSNRQLLLVARHHNPDINCTRLLFWLKRSLFYCQDLLSMHLTQAFLGHALPRPFHTR